MELETYEKALRAEFGDEFSFSEEGALVLGIGEGRMIVLQARPGDEAFSVTVDLGELPDADDPVVLRKLLGANYLYWDTEGGALSYDEKRNRAAFNFLIPVWNLSGEEFLSKLEVVLAVAEEWKGKFDALIGAAPAADDAAAEAGAEAPASAPDGFIQV